MISKETLFSRIINYLNNKNFSFNYYPGCVEPGYDDIPILTANWNIIPHKLFNLIKEQYREEVKLEWSDEWTDCSLCYKALRTSPDSYHWLPSYIWINDCEIACHECYNDPGNEDLRKEIIKYYSKNPRLALPQDFEDILFDKGFECLGRNGKCDIKETGFHEGQNDNPETILKSLATKFHKVWDKTQVCFVFRSKGQFDVLWKVFYRVLD